MTSRSDERRIVTLLMPLLKMMRMFCSSLSLKRSACSPMCSWKLPGMPTMERSSRKGCAGCAMAPNSRRLHQELLEKGLHEMKVIEVD